MLEQDALGNQKARNVYGINLISRRVGTDTLAYMYNGHADVTALLDTNGNLVATYYYDAFGNILEKTGTADNSILYGGYQYDEETGLYYLNARMYDPITARFLQEDTYKGQYNDPLSLNRYAYCNNEPLMYSDPTGHWSLWNAITTAASSVSNTVNNVVHTVGSAVSSAARTIGNAISSTVRTVGSAISSTARTVGSAISSTARTVGSAVSSAARTVGSAVSSAASTVGSAVSSAARTVGSAVSSAARTVGSAVSSAASSVVQAYGEAASSTAQAITNSLSTPVKGSTGTSGQSVGNNVWPIGPIFGSTVSHELVEIVESPTEIFNLFYIAASFGSKTTTVQFKEGEAGNNVTIFSKEITNEKSILNTKSGINLSSGLLSVEYSIGLDDTGIKISGANGDTKYSSALSFSAVDGKINLVLDKNEKVNDTVNQQGYIKVDINPKIATPLTYAFFTQNFSPFLGGLKESPSVVYQK